MNVKKSKLNHAPVNHSLSSKSCNVGTTYYNYTSYTIVICFRDGCFTILPPDDNFQLGMLCVEQTKSNYTTGIQTIDGFEDETLNHIRTKLTRTNGRNVKWEEVIAIDDIINSRSGVYISNLDIHVAVADRIDTKNFHPFCFQHTLNLGLFGPEDWNPESQISFSMQIVDNVYPGVDYYTIVNNEVVHLRSELSFVKEDGLYVYGMPKLFNKDSNKLRRVEIIDLEECLTGKSNYPLFKTVAEANEANSRLSTIQTLSKIELTKHEEMVAKIQRDSELLKQQNAKLSVEKAQRDIEERIYREEYDKKLEKQRQEHEVYLNTIRERAAIETAKAKRDLENLKLLGGAVGFAALIPKFI